MVKLFGEKPFCSYNLEYPYLNCTSFIRNEFFPEVNAEILPPHVYLRSVHNISIERSWLRLRLEWGNNAYLIFTKGITDGLYNPNDKDHQYVFEHKI